uniref:tRNA-splicing endonuclease subunit Sen2 n=1 Tax=Scophthalmus maximus TaxID=52904 RepID=A0A8D3A068_SCOMX
MQAEFRAPRRRTRVHEAYEAPLPVGRSPGERAEFRAELINQHVLVCHRDHIQKIHNQGYFGKGILSRARPDHSISDKWEEHKGLFLPVVSQSRYEEMLRWAEAALVAQGLDGEAVSQILSSISQPVEMEDVRREVAGGKNGHRGEEGPGPEGGVCLGTKRQRSEVEPEAKRSCRLDPQGLNLDHSSDPNHDPDPDPSSDSDPNHDPDPDPSPDTDPNHDPYPDPSSDSDPNLDPDPDPSSDSDPDPEPLVPGSGFVLVVRDSEVGDGVRGVRTTPFSLSEYLQLSPEEAFFLVYSLGCLSVYLHQEPLTIIQLWRKFRSLNPDFVTSYAAYHHFRSRGWVPKGGAKYGVDLSKTQNTTVQHMLTH